MPRRNHDEAVEWPDEAYPSLDDILHRLELTELAEELSPNNLTLLEEENDPEDS